MQIKRLLLVFLAITLPALAAAQRIEAPSARGDGWPVASPAEAGFDPESLSELVEVIDAGTTFPNVHALVIEHQGRLVFERYWPGEDWLLTGAPSTITAHGPDTLHDIRSVSKSVTSLLLGIALAHADAATLDRPIRSFFPDRKGLAPELDAITLHHILTMTAGLAWNETVVPYTERNDFIRMFNSSDPVGFVLSKPLADVPGTRWSYNSGLTDLVAAVIETLTDRPFADYADEVLFAPLAIEDYDWHRPEAWGPAHFPIASAGLRLRARDLAKIGSLVLQDGMWQAERVVPSDWIEVSTTRHVTDMPWGPAGAFGYGYFWSPGRTVSGHQVIRAIGYGGQRVLVLPELGLTVTIFAGNHRRPAPALEQRILGRVIRALR